MRSPSLGSGWLPPLSAGGLKSAYDLTIFALFRGVRPPEETQPDPPRVTSRTAAEATSAPQGGSYR